MPPEWPNSDVMSPPVSASQILPTPSYPTVTTRLPSELNAHTGHHVRLRGHRTSAAPFRWSRSTHGRWGARAETLPADDALSVRAEVRSRRPCAAAGSRARVRPVSTSKTPIVASSPGWVVTATRAPSGLKSRLNAPPSSPASSARIELRISPVAASQMITFPSSTGRRDDRPIRAELDVVDVVRMAAAQREHLLAGGEVPDHRIGGARSMRGRAVAPSRPAIRPG